MPAIMIMASAAALLHSTMVSSGPVIPDGAAAGPLPQNGVWALLPDKCDAPTSLDMNTWPKCATPVGFLDDEVALLEKPGPGKKATPDAFYSLARTKYAIAPGIPALDQGASGPAIAQIVVPMVFSRSYYYLAIAPRALDDAGHFAEARGWPVSCAPRDQGGCNPKTLADVQTQAAIEPTDPQRLYRLVRILPPAPGDSPPAAAAGPKSAQAPSDTITETTLPPPAAAPAAPSPPQAAKPPGA